MRYTHFPTPWDERCSSQRVRFYTVLSSGQFVKVNKHGRKSKMEKPVLVNLTNNC